MLERFGTTTTRLAVAAVIGVLVLAAVAVAWADTAPPSPSTIAATSDEPGEDLSGNCDEAEHADDPECEGATTPSTSSSTVPTNTDDTTGPRPTTTVDDRPSPTSTPTTVTVPPATAPTVPTDTAPVASDDVRSFPAGDAGTVTYRVDGSSFTLVSATPSDGWRVEIEQSSGIEIDLDFRSGTRRVQVDVEFEDGGVRERVRIRDDADDSRTEIENGVVTEHEPGD